jgi:hypothetical protein
MVIFKQHAIAELSQDQVICPPLSQNYIVCHHCHGIDACVLWMAGGFGSGFSSSYTPLLKERTEPVVPDSCSQVAMEMIVMGEYICVEGRYSKAFVKVLGFVFRTQSVCSLWMKTL